MNVVGNELQGKSHLQALGADLAKILLKLACQPLISGGTLKIIAAIKHSPVIAKILAHLGLPIREPPRAPPRAFDRPQNGLIPNRYSIRFLSLS